MMKIKFIIISLLSLFLLFFAAFVYIYRSNMAGHYYGDSDFFGFYQSVRFYFAGQNLYSPTLLKPYFSSHSAWVSADGNLNPPFFTLLLLPLYFFNYAKALKIWTMGSMFFALLGSYLALRPFPQWHKYTLPIITLFFIYIQTSVTLAFGQVTNYLLFFIVCGWLFSRERKDIPAGIFIGMACAVKFFCGLFFLYFLCIRRWKLFFSSALTTAFCFSLSILVFGEKNYLSYQAVLKKISWYASSWNVSFLGFFSRLFSFSEKNHAFFTLPHLTATLTILLSAGLVFYLGHLWQKQKTTQEDFDAGFSLVIIAMILLSPLGWTYYFGLFLIPYLVLIHQSNHDGVHLAGTFLIFFSTLSGGLLHAQEVKTFLQILYFGGIGFYVLILFLALYITSFQRHFSYTQTSAHIAENLWLGIYLAAFSPSLFSLFSVFKNLLTS